MQIRGLRCTALILLSVIFSIGLSFGATASSDSAAGAQGAGNLKEAAPSPLPDDRYKADILVVIAHPDDETLISGYLAKVVLDEGKRVAVLFTTRGNAGDNEVAYEQAASLAMVREIEGRRALASLDITNVWFLNAPDTPAQYTHDVLRSLETSNHGATLGEVVRVIRLTRPGVVITFLPDVVAGENHEDHQASGVIATEAFDMAGDPTRFPEQVAFPDERTGYGNLTEGLRPWQPQKLYYFSDASEMAFMKGKGPEYSVTGVSASRHVPYYRLKAVETSFYQTQIDEGEIAKKALETGDFNAFRDPEQLLLGKSFVGGTATGDVLEGVVAGPIAYAPVRGYQALERTGMSVELGGPWNFYKDFWSAHNLEHLAQLHPTPEIAIGGSAVLPVPLLIRNNTNQDKVVTLRADLPPGWTEKSGSARYPVRAHDVYPVRAMLITSANKQSAWQEIKFSLDSDGGSAGSVTLRVHVWAAQ